MVTCGMDRRRYLAFLGLGSAGSVAGCLQRSRSVDAAATATGDESLTLATATTAHDSGLLADLSSGFGSSFGAPVRTLVRGTGASLRAAKDGDCDVVFVHARSLEDEFLRSGGGINRRVVMYNDFLVAGPPDDPAEAAGTDPVTAFRAIAEARATFLSRGDASGTHVRERHLWDQAEITPSGTWYQETGQGMGTTLVRASEVGAYTLVDRGTFLTVVDEGTLEALVDTGIDDPAPILRNEYAVIPVNPARHDVEYELALGFVGYLTGRGQSTIRSFRVDDRPAFRPIGRSTTPQFHQYVPSDWRQ